MAQFRAKPVVIEAFQWPQGGRHYDDWPAWLQAAWQKDFSEAGAFYRVSTAFVLSTLEGAHVVSPDDWIVQGVQGELFPCKDAIFRATYDAAGD